jgi:hypothetical protein
MKRLDRVASMSGIRSLTMRKALKAPTIMHTMRVRGRAIPEGSPCQMKREIATASASEATEPTERSSPPTEREVDTPMAITVTIDMERRMLTMFVAEGSSAWLSRKRGRGGRS